jgi:hypothetical protein
MIGRLQKIFNFSKGSSSEKRLTWGNAQQYEFKSAIDFMQSELFYKALLTINDKKNLISNGYRDPLLFKEFFGGNETLWNAFVGHITNKSVMEIGPCVATTLSTWDVARLRYVIDPLYNRIVEYQNSQFRSNGFIDIIGYTQPAEKLIEELIGQIDGALLVRNCLDHSPNWPFILNNACDYLSSGAYLLLWNDLMHGPGFESGHFDITDDVDSFRRLIRRFGFDVIVEYSDLDNPNLNWGCLARRTLFHNKDNDSFP